LSTFIGRTLSHYRILRQIGAGGMGEVYEAEDTKLGRRVALKVLPKETARDPQRRQRFDREAKAVAALNHPNIVTIYSVEEADGIDFITMELVEGQTLRQVLPRGGLPLGRLLDLAIPMAEAIAAAHQRGITHRDLKPENILISRDGKVKVLDFGLAKVGEVPDEAERGSLLPTRALTEEGRIVGTVAYMSPEQGEGKQVDPRSDVFTLGIILYEMSTGERPFKGDTAVSLLSSILKDHPPPVSKINATLPRDLARIVDRCLMKDPARRFQTAMGLSTELATLKKDSDSGDLDAIAVGGRRPGRSIAHAAPGLARARSVKYAAAAAIVVGAAVAGFIAFREWRGVGPGDAGGPVTKEREVVSRDDRQRIVVLPFENLGASDDGYFAAGVTEEITSRLASVSGLGVISRTSAVQYAKTGKTTRQIGSELGVDYLLGGTVRWERGGAGSSRVRVTPQLVRVADDTQLWGDRYDREMKDIFAVQSEIAEQVVQKLGLALQKPERQVIGTQPTQNLDAYQTYLRGKAEADRPDMTRAIVEQADRLLEQAVQLDPKFAVAWAELSKVHSSAYHFRWDFTEERLVKARECADRALALQPDLREGHLALGYYYYWGRGDYAQALAEFQAVAGDRRDDPEVLESMAYIWRRQGRWDESIAAMEKAFALNPRDAELATNLSGAYQTMRRYPDALRFADIALSLAQDAPGLYLGKLFVQIEADGNTRGARETLKKINPRDLPEVACVESYLDEVDGRYEEALDALSRFSKDALESPTLYRPKPLLAGMIYLEMHDRDRAQVACESARQILDKEVARNPRDPRMRSALGLALACLGRKDEAVREARLAADILPVSSDALDGPVQLQSLAMTNVMVGDYDAALDLLDKLLSFPSGTSVHMLKLDPSWAPLWKLPRFKKLMEKYG
jgi:eukaryotic-like serine/threonine-protein kinase